MGFTSGPVFTNAGKELHARAMAGKTLKFTTMKLGDGSLGSTAIANLTALVHAVTSVNITTLRHSGDYAAVSGMFTNKDLSTGFYWREIGLFAADPDAPDDRSRDILYCYQNAGNTADYIAASSSELITKRINIAAIVSGAANVSATLSANTSADAVTFDNSKTDLEAEDVQAALEEIVEMVQKISGGEVIADLLKGKADLGADGKVKVEQLPEISSAKTYTVTLSENGWREGDDGRFQQGVTIEGVKADSPIVLVDVDLSVDNLEVKKAILEAWATVSANEVEQYDGAMLFYALEQPTISIPVNVGVM